MFAAPLAARLKPLGEALDARPVLSGDYPRDEADLRRMLAEGGVRLEDLRDPWGTPFRVWLGTIEGEDVLEVITAAADKRAGTGDDFIALRRGWPYFHHTGAAIERALRRHHERTGGLLNDRAALRRELLAEGIDFDALRDRWGRPYELQTETNRDHFILRVRSAGPDTRFGARHAADDFTISTARVNYFERVRQFVNAALDRAIVARRPLPRGRGRLARAAQPRGRGRKAPARPVGPPLPPRLRRSARGCRAATSSAATRATASSRRTRPWTPGRSRCGFTPSPSTASGRTGRPARTTTSSSAASRACSPPRARPRRRDRRSGGRSRSARARTRGR